MQFQKMEYVRPDRAALITQIQSLTEALTRAATYEDARNCFLESEKLFRHIDTMSELVNIRHCINTKDPYYNSETDFWNSLSPVLGAHKEQWENALLNSAFRPDFEAEYGELLFSDLILQKGIFSNMIADDLKEENALMREYERLQASAMIPFEGGKYTLSQMRPFKTDPDDQKRLSAWQAEGNWYKSHSEELDQIFDKLVHVRDRMGKKLGYDGYLPLGYKVRRRNCYTKETVAAYRNAVIQYVVPLAASILKQQANRTGVKYPMSFADLALEYRDGNPLPLYDTQGILKTTAKFFHSLSPEAGSFFQMMLDNGLMDVISRDGKASGGYCASFPEYEVPFIFTNFNGTQEDVQIITHESGHAFEVYTNRKRVPYRMIWPTGEACEVNSVGMEFFGELFADAYFGSDAQKYRSSHLAQTVAHIPYGAAIDHFQHIAYERPDLTPAQRHEVWKELLDNYMPWLSLGGGIPFYGEGMGWQAQRHIFIGPLYYIDYSLAETVGLEFWSLIRKDPQDAWERYMTYTALGGSDTFLGLLERARLSSPFDAKHLQNLCELIQQSIHSAKG